MFCKIVVCSFVLFLLASIPSIYRFVDRRLSFFFWPLCCLSFDLRLLNTRLVSIFKLFFPRDSIMILHMNMTVFDPSGHRPWKLLSSLLWRLLRSVEWLLFNAIWAIFQIYRGKNKLHFDEVLMSALSWTSIQLMLAHWNNSPRVDKSLHSWHIIPI